MFVCVRDLRFSYSARVGVYAHVYVHRLPMHCCQAYASLHIYVYMYMNDTGIRAEMGKDACMYLCLCSRYVSVCIYVCIYALYIHTHMRVRTHTEH